MAETAALTPLEILLVEDNPADVRVTREALQLTRLQHRLHVVGDGESALAFVRREGPYAQAPQLQLILLDLALPGIGGHLVLARLGAERARLGFRVVVLSGSNEVEDMRRSFDLEADEYITKPDSVLHYASRLVFACRLVGVHRP